MSATREEMRSRDGALDGYRELLEVEVPENVGAYRARHGHDPSPRDVGHWVWRRLCKGENWTRESILADIEAVSPPPPPPPPPSERAGLVRLQRRVFLDDRGLFLGLGASFFPLLWGVKHQPERTEQTFGWLHDRGVQYVRALTMVGAQPYWADRVIDPNAADHWGWVGRATEMAMRWGLRIQWVIFADAQVMMPDQNDRTWYLDEWANYLGEHRETVMFAEVANEHWQNGVELEELRWLSKRLRQSVDVLVAASAPERHEPDAFDRVYSGEIADLATVHWDRKWGDGGWRHARQAWFERNDPPIISNEGMGPRSSVASETDPAKLVAAMLVAYVAGGPSYCFHCDTGVRWLSDFWDDPQIDVILRALQQAHRLVPTWVPNGTRINHYQPGHPFEGSFDLEGGQSRQIWPDRLDHYGVVRAFSTRRGRNWVLPLVGIRDHVRLTAPRALAFTVSDPSQPGDVPVERHLQRGESIEFRGLMGAPTRVALTDFLTYPASVLLLVGRDA